MGLKNSKVSFLNLTYEEAEKRVTDKELKRLREAFRRSSGSGFMTKNQFLSDVLGDCVPIKIAEEIFQFLASSPNGLQFKDLVVALVLLTRGKQHEKIRFLFCLYSNEQGTFVERPQFEKYLLETEARVPSEVSRLFKSSDKVNFEQFSYWLQIFKGATAFSTWLLKELCVVTLSDNHDMPTFYQILAGVTHLDEHDVMELEKRYWQLKNRSNSGKLDLETFKKLVSPPVPEQVVSGLFWAFDDNRDDHIDFKEMSCGISACCRGPVTERQKFCFKIFDSDHDGFLTESDIRRMLSTMLEVHQDNLPVDDSGDFPPLYVRSASVVSKDADPQVVDRLTVELMNTHHQERRVSTEEYLMWTLNNTLPDAFLHLLYQVCHIVLGLRPQYRLDERRVILDWVTRERRHGLCVEQSWYLISHIWWNSWLTYVSYKSPEVTTHDDSCIKKTNINTLQKPKHQKSYSFNFVTSNSYNFVSAQNADGDGVSTLRMSNRVPQRPGAIDNSSLINSTYRLMSLTNEGGVLKRRSDGSPLQVTLDFEPVPEAVWWALQYWYGGGPSIPRLVIKDGLELYPLSLQVWRHQMTPASQVNNRASVSRIISGVFPSGMVAPVVDSGSLTCRRSATNSACFSRLHTLTKLYSFFSNRFNMPRDSIRLWHYVDDNNLRLLDDDTVLLGSHGIQEDGGKILLEVRNRDLTWPEELHALAKTRSLIQKRESYVKGATGLNNLGNTCFLNSALQCVSHTNPLTVYFDKNMHLFEINRSNPLGMKGHMAERYYELVRDLWNSNASVIAPLKLRMTIARYSTRFSGNQQHDSQEFLSFLLDGLHEDLNRVTEKPYTELRDSDGRPDSEVAGECWENHLARNQSIIVDLFHGQLRTAVSCKKCGGESVKFDPFSVLSLPLPLENSLLIEVIVCCLDDSRPTRFGVLLNHEDKYAVVRKAVAARFNVSFSQVVLSAILASTVSVFPEDESRVRSLQTGCQLFAFILPGVPEDLACDEQPPQLSRNSSLSSIADAGTSATNAKSKDPRIQGFTLAYHRKQVCMDVYFLSHQKTRLSLFGLPSVIPLRHGIKNQDVYEMVWQQVRRLVSPLPDFNVSQNHALVGDISQVSEKYPFQLKVVCAGGLICALCPWFRFCRGCLLPCDSGDYVAHSDYLAADWEPTTLHLRYQSSAEQAFDVDPSLERLQKTVAEPMTLEACLQAFTRTEELSDPWKCGTCKEEREARLSLQLWRLPPILIVHLKRFQCLGNRWVKSHKIVTCCLRGLDLRPFSAAEAPASSDTRYSLYAFISHSGILGGGHYVAYTRNPNGQWFLFNDSSVKPVLEEELDLSSAYLLFYERSHLSAETFLPDISGRQPLSSDTEADEVDSALKTCSLH